MVYIPFTNRGSSGATWISSTELKVNGNKTLKITHNITSLLNYFGEDNWNYPIYGDDTLTTLDVFVNGFGKLI